MADELNIPTHRWYEPRNNIRLPKQDFSRDWIYDSGIQKIDAWINSQPWGNPVANLFALNEPGIWLDPSDLTTMFQDRAGITAVTTPGQSVGLRLDKSKGLVLGSEQAPSLPDYQTILTGTWAASGANYVFTDTVGGQSRPGVQWPTVSLVAGSYQIVVVVAAINGATQIRLDGVGATDQFLTVGSNTRIVSVTSTSRPRFRLEDLSTTIGDSFTITSISVKELPGNHAVANSDAARGIYGIEPLGGRRNLLTFTEQFDNAAWLKTSGAAVAANTNIAPDGTATADTVSDSSAIFNSVSQASAYSSTMTATIYVRKDSIPRTTRFSLFRIAFSGGTARDAQVALDTSTGEVSSAGSTATVNSATAVDAGDYWRFTISGTDNGANTSVNLLFFPAAGASSTWVLTASVTGSAVIWGAQLETGSTATAYQRVVDQYNVTEAGKQTLHYVQYDGSDDGYVTPTITPGTDKVQVFAGMRKLSDVTRAVFMEWSTTSANNGTFAVEAPAVAADPRFTFFSRGTAVVGPGVNNAIYAAPNTRVLTGIGDISGDNAILRLNGTQVSQATGDQGTGNYLAYPLYIGRRAGTEFPFNGRDYGIITRFGANLDASTIAATENWLNQRTGAF